MNINDMIAVSYACVSGFATREWYDDLEEKKNECEIHSTEDENKCHVYRATGAPPSHTWNAYFVDLGLQLIEHLDDWIEGYALVPNNKGNMLLFIVGSRYVWAVAPRVKEDE